ncbi:unnamed protein product [Owenia fusiformis]|uniref:Uncharacterized protein n=1 Tax=Owenia fusiformis TaxID=6347 RepID=A0A8J1U945_OWEFU|nr:unnamed protein product [Owenia fusiformis]
MARRRLETAIQAGKAIEQGKQWPEEFTKLEVLKELKFDYDRDGVYCLQFSLDSEQLAVGFGNGGIQVFDAHTLEKIQDIKPSRYGGGLAVTCIRYHPKQHHIFFASNSEGQVLSCNTKAGTFDVIIEEKQNEINCLDFSLDGFNFATAGKDLTVRIYDTQSQQLSHVYQGYNETAPPVEFQVPGHAQRVFALKYHPENNHILITGGWDNHLKVWDTRSQDGVKRTIGGPHICGDSLDVRGFKILTGSWVAQHSLQIWDYNEGVVEKNIPFPHGGHGEFLYCAQFCDNDVVIAGGSGTHSIQAVNTVSGKCLGEIKMEKPVQALDTTKGGRLFAIGGGDNRLILGSLS